MKYSNRVNKAIDKFIQEDQKKYPIDMDKPRILTHKQISSRGGQSTKRAKPYHFTEAGKKSWDSRFSSNPNAGNELALKGTVARKYRKAEVIAADYFELAGLMFSYLTPVERESYEKMIDLLFSGELDEKNVLGYIADNFGKTKHVTHVITDSGKIEKKKPSFLNTLLGKKNG